MKEGLVPFLLCSVDVSCGCEITTSKIILLYHMNARAAHSFRKLSPVRCVSMEQGRGSEGNLPWKIFLNFILAEMESSAKSLGCTNLYL